MRRLVRQPWGYPLVLASNAVIVLGIDPSPMHMPACYDGDNGMDCEAWACDLLDVCHKHIWGIKLQSAYFESYGLRGLHALSAVIRHAKTYQLPVIMDAKRGDIGATSHAYAMAYLADKNNGGNADFSSDYLTVNPLMGDDCLQPFLDVAVLHNKGLFVLLETSNPGAAMILQQPLHDQSSVSQCISAYIQAQHAALKIDPQAWGPIGCVIGATSSRVAYWRKQLPNSVFLMPGIGAQGGDWSAIQAGLNDRGEGVLVPISRGITSVSDATDSRRQYQNAVLAQLMSHVQQMKLGIA